MLISKLTATNSQKTILGLNMASEEQVGDEKPFGFGENNEPKPKVC